MPIYCGQSWRATRNGRYVGDFRRGISTQQTGARAIDNFLDGTSPLVIRAIGRAAKSRHLERTRPIDFAARLSMHKSGAKVSPLNPAGRVPLGRVLRARARGAERRLRP